MHNVEGHAMLEVRSTQEAPAQPHTESSTELWIPMRDKEPQPDL